MCIRDINNHLQHHDVAYEQKRFYRYACIPYALAPYTNTAPLAITINAYVYNALEVNYSL
jgi:hypothetical protein